MLDEHEFSEVQRLYLSAIRDTKDHRRRSGVDLKDPSIHELFKPVRDHYERLTGMKESNQNAIMHHRISLYGPLCKRCHKPLRRAKAKICGSCMFPVDQD
jgi:hypothetical protein